MPQASHVAYDPLHKTSTLPVFPLNPSVSVEAYPPSGFIRPLGIDLDVTYISRDPLYHRYEVVYSEDGRPIIRPGTEDDQRWPAQGEVVTFTAHVRNKGYFASGKFTFKWFVDDQEVAVGTIANLPGGDEITTDFQWEWAHAMDGERLLGSHTLKFSVDPDNKIAETYESNNSLEDRTDALSLVLALTPDLYTALETPVDPQWPFSAEDWLQKQVAALNAAFERSGVKGKSKNHTPVASWSASALTRSCWLGNRRLLTGRRTAVFF